MCSSTCIRATGVQYFVSSLVHLQLLDIINLEGNQVRDEGAKVVWPLVSELNCPDDVFLKFNGITDEGAAAFLCAWAAANKTRLHEGSATYYLHLKTNETGQLVLEPCTPKRRREACT
jgi:hypothetical protein